MRQCGSGCRAGGNPRARCWKRWSDRIQPRRLLPSSQTRQAVTPGQFVLDGEDDDRTCQNLRKRRAFSVVILANWPLAFANSCDPIEPVEKRLSRTAITVSQLSSATLHLSLIHISEP